MIILCSALEGHVSSPGLPMEQKQYGYTASTNSHENYKGIRPSGMLGEVDRAGTLLPGKEKHRGNLINMSS